MEKNTDTTAPDPMTREEATLLDKKIREAAQDAGEHMTKVVEAGL